jgi:hypothetical protein
MPEHETDPALLEIDRLLNDPDVPMQADLVWRLLERRNSGEPRGA